MTYIIFYILFNVTCMTVIVRMCYEPFQRGDRLYTSESDVCRRQILTYKDGLRTEINIAFLLAVDP